MGSPPFRFPIILGAKLIGGDPVCRGATPARGGRFHHTPKPCFGDMAR